MDILFLALVSGMAVSYVVELISLVIQPRVVRLSLTLPLSVLSAWLLGLTNFQLAIAALAAAFFAQLIARLLDKPIVIQNQRRL